MYLGDIYFFFNFPHADNEMSRIIVTVFGKVCHIISLQTETISKRKNLVDACLICIVENGLYF